MKGRGIEAKLQKRSQKLTRSILGGAFSQQIAPFLPDFPKDLKASEARFIGKPIDFLIFKGMDDQHQCCPNVEDEMRRNDLISRA